MLYNKHRPVLVTVLAVAFALVIAALPLLAEKSLEKKLYNFCSLQNCADGGTPETGMVLDNSGRLYGTSAGGGPFDCGNVFELSPDKGKWKETVLYNFSGNGIDGCGPDSLIMDESGNLYGTTWDNDFADGTAFELTPHSNGVWTEHTLHHFSGGADGKNPYGLAMDSNGDLYGTCFSGGGNREGTAWELVNDGRWTESVLYNFCSLKDCEDGASPLSGVILDGAGNLYGTTSFGGASGAGGTVFELTPSNGTWTETVLHSFPENGNEDGETPNATLIFDSVGDLYGVTQNGGTYGDGTVFELVPGSGSWSEAILHNFEFKDGVNPSGSLTFDAHGDLYGITAYGGRETCGYEQSGCGVVFRLARKSFWAETTLHKFHGNDGTTPTGWLVFDKAGHLYGTAISGGPYSSGAGTAFEITP